MSETVGPDPAGPDAVAGAAGSSGPTRGALVRSSALVAVGTALSRVTGLLRVVALLYALDLTRLSDAYNAANTMPNLIYELLLGGILSATLVPVFVDARDRGDDDATSAVVSTAGIALVVVTVVGLVAAPGLVSVITEQADDPAEAAAQQEVATFLLRLFIPQVLFYGFITVVTALLHSRRSFAAPAFSPILNNLVVSAMFFALPSVIDYAIDRESSIFRADDDTTLLLILGIGTTAGVAAMALGLVPSLVRQRIRVRFRPDWRHPAVRTVVRLSGWTVGYVIANQIALYVVLALANGSGEGELSAYQAAFIFFQLPHGLVAVSVMTTFLPELTEAARTGDRPAFRERFALGTRLIAVAALPAAAGYVALSREIVDLLPLGSTSVDLTADVLAMFALGLLPFSVYLFALRGFYAHQDTRTPFVVNVLQNGLNIAFAFPLVAAAGVAGLAGAYSAAYALASVVAVWALARRVGGLPGRELSGALGRMLVAAVACGGVAWLVARGTDDLPVELSVGAAALAGGGAYVLVALALRVEELTLARRLVTSRVRRPGG